MKFPMEDLIKEEDDFEDVTLYVIDPDSLAYSLKIFKQQESGTASDYTWVHRKRWITYIMDCWRQYYKYETTPRSDVYDMPFGIKCAADFWTKAYTKKEWLIPAAVKIDCGFEVNDGIPIASPVMKIAESFKEAVEVWNNMKWLKVDRVGVQLSEEVATMFAELIKTHAHHLQDLVLNSDYDYESTVDNKQLDLTEKVCFVINNIATMHQHLVNIITNPKYLGLKQHEQMIKASKKDFEDQIEDLANTAAEFMRSRLRELLFAIPQALEKAILCPFEDITIYLLEYTDNIVCKIGQTSQKKLLGIVRSTVMTDLLLLVKQQMVLCRQRGNASLWADHYLELLMRCVDCLNCYNIRDVGRSTTELQGCQKQELVQWHIEMFQIPTDDLIFQYIDSRIDLQEKAVVTYGKLTAKVTYLPVRNIIQVAEISCKNFLQMYKDGTSDVFMEIHVFPSHMFPESPCRTTKFKKAQQKAHFLHEVLEFHISEDLSMANHSIYIGFHLFNSHCTWPCMMEEGIGQGFIKYNPRTEQSKDVAISLALPHYRPGVATHLFDLLSTFDLDNTATHFTEVQKKLEKYSEDILSKYTRSRCCSC